MRVCEGFLVLEDFSLPIVEPQNLKWNMMSITKSLFWDLTECLLIEVFKTLLKSQSHTAEMICHGVDYILSEPHEVLEGL